MARKRRWWIVAAGIALGWSAAGTSGAQDGPVVDGSSPATWKAAGSSRPDVSGGTTAGAQSSVAGDDRGLPSLPDSISGMTRGMDSAEPRGAKPLMTAVKSPGELAGTHLPAAEGSGPPTWKMIPVEPAREAAEKSPAVAGTPGKPAQPFMVGVPGLSIPPGNGVLSSGDSAADREVIDLPVHYPSPPATETAAADKKTPDAAEQPRARADQNADKPPQKTQTAARPTKTSRTSRTTAAPVARKSQTPSGVVQAQYQFGAAAYRPQAPPTGECNDCRHGPVSSHSGWNCALEKFQLQQAVLGFPSEFHESPLGYFLYAQARTMVANGTAARLALYQYDFCDHSEQLNPQGRDQLRKIAAMLPGCFGIVIIERTGCDPQLDEARRAMVLAELGQCGFPVPEERVVVGPPMAYGLHGIEADLVYRNLLIQTQTGGVQAGVGGGSIGGTVGQGFGATGRTASGR